MRVVLRHIAVAILGTLYVSVFWFRPPRGWPRWLGASRRFLIDTAADLTGWPNNWSWVLVSVVFGALIPVVVLLLLRRKPGEMLLGLGTRLGWRLIAICYGVAFLGLLYLASREGFRDYYTGMMRHGLLKPLGRFTAVIIAEHIIIQGAILRLALGPRHHWPADPEPPGGTSLRARLCRLLGFGSGQGWLGNLRLDGNVIGALLAQAFVFFWVHVSKDVGELLMSFPGGFALGYLAWRAQSVWPCVVLHTLTGTSVILLAILLFGLPVGG